MCLNEGPAHVELDLAGREIVVSFYRLAGVDGTTNRRSEWRLRPIRCQLISPNGRLQSLDHSIILHGPVNRANRFSKLRNATIMVSLAAQTTRRETEK